METDMKTDEHLHETILCHHRRPLPLNARGRHPHHPLAGMPAPNGKDVSLMSYTYHLINMDSDTAEPEPSTIATETEPTASLPRQAPSSPEEATLEDLARRLNRVEKCLRTIACAVLVHDYDFEPQAGDDPLTELARAMASEYEGCCCSCDLDDIYSRLSRVEEAANVHSYLFDD